MGFHLAEYYEISVGGNDVHLQMIESPVSLKYGVALFYQVVYDCFLSEIANVFCVMGLVLLLIINNKGIGLSANNKIFLFFANSLFSPYLCGIETINN